MPTRKVEIVKVQIPLDDPDEAALVYAKGHRRLSIQELSREVLDAMNDDVKGYFMAVWDGNQWQIGARIPDQPW